MVDNLADLRAVNSELKDQLSMSRLNNSIIEEAAVKTSEAVGQCLEERRRVKEAVAQEKARIAAAQQRNAGLEVEIEMAERELGLARRLEAGLRLAESERLARKRQLEETRERLTAEVRRLLVSVDERSDVLQSEHSLSRAADMDVIRLEKELAYLEHRTDDARVKKHELEVEVAELRAELEHKNRNCDQLRGDFVALSKLEREFARLRDQYRVQIAEAHKKEDMMVLSRLVEDNRRIERLQDELDQTLRTVSHG